MKTIYKAIDIHQADDVPVIAAVSFDRAYVGLLLVTDSGVIKANLLMDRGEALALGNRLNRAAELALREAEDNVSG